MNEADLTQLLMARCRATMPFAMVLKHADRFNKSYPDMTVSWSGPTSWWEIKFYNDEPFESPVGQEIKCQQLAEQSICFYVIYELRKGVRRTVIVEPERLETWKLCERNTGGFDHAFVAQFIREMHEYYRFKR